jgi:hypothetical protein
MGENNMKEKDKDLAMLIGLLLGDGGISVISKNRFEIFLTSNSRALRESFRKCLENIFPEKKLRFEEISNKTVKKIRICDKEIGEQLLSFSPTFRTRPCNTFPICPMLKGKPEKAVCRECRPINGFPPVKIPEFIANGSPELKRLIVKGVMSCDGGIEFHPIKNGIKVNFQRRLFLRCHNPFLLAQWRKIFEDLGFDTTITKNEIRISGKNQLEKFKKEIGFIEGVEVKRSKNWKGIDKNMLLDIVIKSFSTSSAPKANRAAS